MGEIKDDNKPHRASDQVILAMYDTVAEMNQKITEIHYAVPRIKDLEKTLYGDDKKSGLCGQVITLESNFNNSLRLNKIVINSIGWVLGLFISIAGLFIVFIEFIWKNK